VTARPAPVPVTVRAPRLLPVAATTPRRSATLGDALVLGAACYLVLHLTDLVARGNPHLLLRAQDALDDRGVPPGPAIVTALYGVMFATVTIWLALVRSATPRAWGLRFAREDVPFAFRLGGALGLLATAAVGVTAACLARIRSGEPLRAAVAALAIPVLERPHGALFLAITMVLAAPLAEEALFRGVIYGALRTRLGAPPAAIVQAALFAAWHIPWDPEDLLVPRPEVHVLQYAFGLLAAWTVERRSTLATAIALHAGGNALAIILMMMTTWHPEVLLKVFGVS
jgi:membrane protease YdiL (CAAX protease family)